MQAEEVDEERDNGQRSDVKMHQPWTPTHAEREEDAMAHLALRSWREYCAKG